MINKILMLVGIIVTFNANAAYVDFDKSGTDPNGANNFGQTTVLDLPAANTSAAFDFAGTLDLVGNLNKAQAPNITFGLYKDGSLLKDITQFVEDSTNNTYTFDFKNLVAGTYNLRFNVNGNNAARFYTLDSKISPTKAITPVPEPETFALFAVGLGLMGAVVSRRKSA